MIVVGGGVIGLEMGSVYARLGTEVTVVQHTERICPFLDAEIGKAFTASLKKQGIKFLLNTRVVNGVNNKEKGVTINLQNVKTEANFVEECDIALVSIGRHAFTGGLQLEKAGLETNDRGVIPTNDHW
jgi:dihydrolipoamide dehydrogenase